MLAFFQMFFGQIFSNELLRRMVLVGPRNSHHTPRGFVLILNQRICGAGGGEIRLRSGFKTVLLTWMLAFFQIFLAKLFFDGLLCRMVLVGPRNSHHTLRGVVLILNQRIRGAGGRNTPTEWL